MIADIECHHIQENLTACIEINEEGDYVYPGNINVLDISYLKRLVLSGLTKECSENKVRLICEHVLAYHSLLTCYGDEDPVESYDIIGETLEVSLHYGRIIEHKDFIINVGKTSYEYYYQRLYKFVGQTPMPFGWLDNNRVYFAELW